MSIPVAKKPESNCCFLCYKGIIWSEQNSELDGPSQKKKSTTVNTTEVWWRDYIFGYSDFEDKIWLFRNCDMRDIFKGMLLIE